MAWTNGHWCMIHVPKTSGGWVTRVMGGEVKRDGPAHGLPLRWDYPIIFTVLREPADWLRSAWGNRMMEHWNPYPREVPWQGFCSLTREFQSSNFDDFARRLMARRPGIIEWLFDCYTPPGVEVVRYGDELYQWLRDMGYKPDGWKPYNVSSTHGTVISPETRKVIYKGERWLYKKYGWSKDGSYEY